MFDIAAIIIVLSVTMVFCRAIKGPTIYDRLLAVNLIGTKAVVLLAVIGFIYQRPHFLDISIVYALINFITSIAFLKYIRMGRLD